MKTLSEKIAEAIEKYHRGLMQKRVLKTMEEIEANTDTQKKYLVGSDAVAELNNKLAGQPEFLYDSDGKITGYKTPGGADAVFPFSSAKNKSVFLQMGRYGGARGRILLHTFDCDSIAYKVNAAGTFTIGLITSYPTNDYTAAVSNIESQKLYGYTQVLSQGLNAGQTGVIKTKGYKGIYITQTQESSVSSITMTYI